MRDSRIRAVKFSCERCGKRYATADRPAPGRSYKLKCKACGHLIVVRVAAGEPGVAEPRLETPDGARLVPAPPGPVPPPESALAAAAAPDANAPPAPRIPSPFLDATTDVTMPRPVPDTGALTPPPRPGYVDLFSDLGEEDAEAERDGPLLGAEGAALPGRSGPGAGAPGPLGVSSEAPSERTPARAVPAPLPAPKVPTFPKAAQQRSTLPFVFMGIGVLLLAGILAFVMLSAGTRAPPAETPREQAAASPPEPPPAAAPPAAAPAPGSKQEADARRRREREAAAARAEKARLERAARESAPSR
jgi:hypothetical protein